VSAIGDSQGAMRVLLALAVLLLAGCVAGSDDPPQAEAPAAPEGMLAFGLPRARGWLITDFLGRSLRTISLPQSRAPIGRPQFNRTGSRLWFLAGSGPSEGRKRLWLHVVPTRARSPGRSYALRVSGSRGSGVLVSPDEQQVAVGGTWPKNPRACGSFATVSGRGEWLASFEAGPGVQYTAAAWSPDSTRLAYLRHDWGSECGKFSHSGSLGIAAGDEAGWRRWVSSQPYGLVGPAGWSPDGFDLAFSQLDQRGDLGKAPLHVMHVAGTSRRDRVLVPDGYPSAIVWYKRTNELLTLRAEPSGITGIWAVDARSAARRLVFADGAAILASSSNGGRLAIYRSLTETKGEYGILNVATGAYWPFPHSVQRRANPETGALAYFIR
jgi:hypothetical protein